MDAEDGSTALGRLRERAGIVDDAIVQRLRALGYTDETVILIRLIPLIAVAWADGSVSENEREAIRAEAQAQGVESGTPADRQLGEWLTAAPSEAFQDASVQILAASANGDLDGVLTACRKVASASGGLFGFRAISPREQDVLDRLANAFVRKGIATPHR
jgi:hypothetical protein